MMVVEEGSGAGDALPGSGLQLKAWCGAAEGEDAMFERDIIKQIREMRAANHCFVKWWRKENDFLDYELIDDFIERSGDSSRDIAGFELLTQEEMWERLAALDRANLSRGVKGGREVIFWKWPESSGGGTSEYPYEPRAVMEIFDKMTRGNPVG